MKKFLLILLFALLPISISGFYPSTDSKNSVTKWDMVIANQAYVSLFNKSAKNPVAVVYKLYKGGGPCKRDHFHFKPEKGIPSATSGDYSKSGYDEGHMANAEDFANNCTNDELTFRFYNCVPQTKELNRGIWRSLETAVRDSSQKDSLLVMCLNVYSDTSLHLKKTSVLVPTHCIKVVKSMSTGKYLWFEIFTNTSTPVESNATKEEVEALFGNKIESIEKQFYLSRKDIY